MSLKLPFFNPTQRILWASDWQRRSFVMAVLISISIHLLLLFWSYQSAPPKANHLKAPLAVVLVNSQSKLAPIKPQKLAQNDLNGGGLMDSHWSATAIAAIHPGVAKQLDELQKEQTRLIAQRSEQGSMALNSRVGKSLDNPEKADLLEAELAQRLQSQSQRPRKATMTATSSKAVIYAQYYDAMRKKVEQYGTTYFPRVGNTPLYGSLILLISVDKSGKMLAKPTIEKSSGNPELDQQAIAIVNACAPFGRFSPAMMAKLDAIDWIATFHFLQGNGRSQLELKAVR